MWPRITLSLLLSLSVSSATTKFRTVELHLLEKDNQAVLNLYTLKTMADGSEYPMSSTFQVAYDNKTSSAHEYYIDRHLIYTDFSLNKYSTLWYFWGGAKIGGRRLTLLSDAHSRKATKKISCIKDKTSSSSHPCMFRAQIAPHGEFVDVTLFNKGKATLLPMNLFKKYGKQTEITFRVGKERMTVNGPFDVTMNKYVTISELTRHEYSFELYPNSNAMTFSKNDIYQVTETTDILLTALVIYSSLTIIYCWSHDEFTPTTLFIFLTFALLPLQFIHPHPLHRLVLSIYITICGLYFLLHKSPHYITYVIFAALECLSSASTLLHETTENMSTLVVSAAIAVASIVYLTGDHKSQLFFFIDVIFVLLSLITFSVSHAAPYIALEFDAKYGFDTSWIVIFISLFLITVAMHLKEL